METVKPKLLRETKTSAEMKEIDVCRTTIRSVVQHVKAQQEEALKEQKKITKRCYDMFSKYEGVEQSSDWMRSFWFGLHTTERDQRFNKDYDVDESRQCLPAEWRTKMRFGKPSSARRRWQ